MYFEMELNIKGHFKRGGGGLGLLLTWLREVKAGVKGATGLPGAAGDAGGQLPSPPLMAWRSWVAPPWTRPPRWLLHFDWLVRCSSPPSQILAS